MALNKIEKQDAFHAGCDLWLIGEPAQSRWAQMLDWRLNFQLRRASLHRSRELSPEIKSVIAEFEVEVPEGEFSAAGSVSVPIMIASKTLLPNSQTISIGKQATMGEWVSACHKAWKSLGRPATRVFLPDEMTYESFRRGWPGADLDLANIEVV